MAMWPQVRTSTVGFRKIGKRFSFLEANAVHTSTVKGNAFVDMKHERVKLLLRGYFLPFPRCSTLTEQIRCVRKRTPLL